MDIKTKNTYWLNAAVAALIVLALVIGLFGGVGGDIGIWSVWGTTDGIFAPGKRCFGDIYSRSGGFSVFAHAFVADGLVYRYVYRASQSEK